MNSSFKLSFSFLFLLFFLSACSYEKSKEHAPLYSDSPPLAKNKIYIFGVHPLHNPKRLFEVYEPLIKRINSKLQGSELRLEASRDYAAFNEKLFSGYFDFALPNPYQTLIATQKGYRVFGKMGDDENFRGLILTRKDSNISTIQQLKGKKISYPAPTALAATIMPQWYLHQNGLNVNKDITNLYVGSQESSIMNLYLHKSAAAATWPPPWEAFVKARPEIAKELVVTWQTTPLLNNGLVAREDIPAALVDAVGEVIFSLHTDPQGKKILAPMELSHYEKANNATYEGLKSFIENFQAQVRVISDDGAQNED